MMIHCLPPFGFVRLVSYMQPVPEVQQIGEGHAFESYLVERHLRPKDWTGDLEIVRNARVSFDADWRTGMTVEHQRECFSLLPAMSNGEKRDCNCKPRVVSDERLIRYLWSHEHTTPFEAMVFTFEIKAPIFVFRQWHRHRTWSYNEVSARYAELPEEWYVPSKDKIGYQDPKNKQARIMSNPFQTAAAYDPTNPAHVHAAQEEELDRQRRMVEGFDQEAEYANQKYRARLGEGCPREIARINLPLSQYSRMFATVDLHNLFHFFALRDHDHAQYEIRVYAKALKELIRPIVPYALNAFETIKWVVSEDLEQAKGEVNVIDHKP